MLVVINAILLLSVTLLCCVVERLVTTMPLYWKRLSAVAALAAFYVGFSPSKAEEMQTAAETEDFNKVGLHELLRPDSFANLDQMLQQAMASLSGLFGPMDGIVPFEGTSLALNLSDEKSCKIKILIEAAGVTVNDVKLGLDPVRRRVTASYDSTRMEEKHDPERGDSRASRSVHMQSAILLPERCLASPSVLLLSLAGYLIDTEASRGLVVFPSSALLREYAEEGLLPKDITELIEGGDQVSLSALTPAQQCLAAGFTKEDCQKMDDKKPNVALVSPVDGSSVPIPQYDVRLERLD